MLVCLGSSELPIIYLVKMYIHVLMEVTVMTGLTVSGNYMYHPKVSNKYYMQVVIFSTTKLTMYNEHVHVLPQSVENKGKQLMYALSEQTSLRTFPNTMTS